MRFARLATAAVVTGAMLSTSVSRGAPRQHAAGKSAPADVRYTDVTPDAMIAAAEARALAHGAKDHAVLGAIATITSLGDRATDGVAEKALAAIAAAPAVAADLRDEAALARRTMEADEGQPAGIAADAALGVITHVALLGPFRDTGGGLARKEGPEKPGATAFDPREDDSWGTVQVGWREVPDSYAQANGIPLDVFVEPRRESCTYVGARVELTNAVPIVVHAASTGQVRLVFDGKDLGSSDETNTSMTFDRLAAKVDAKAGEHVLLAKVCSGALDDDGRVRLRITGASVKADIRPPKGPIAIGPQKVTRVPTPLERVVGGTPALEKKVEGAADADALLDAILARTLGGADDNKSPRAPGMLDRLTHLVPNDADRLAMAGWVAPSGANRSGWLHEAAAVGARTHDDRARLFAERRLVAQHLSARMPDWARAAANTVLKGATDSEAVLMNAVVDEGLGVDALRLRALRSLADYADAHADAPNALLEDLGKLAAGVDPARAMATRAKLWARGARGAAYVESVARRGSRADVVKAAREAMKTGAVGDADEVVRVVRAVGAAGAHDAAQKLAAIAVAMAPNEQDAWAALAEQTRGASPQAGAQIAQALGAPSPAALVDAALRRARELQPSEARYRAQLALDAAARGHHGMAESPKTHDDEKYMVPASTFLARRVPVPAQPDVADRQLHWVRAVVMHDDRRVSQMIQYAREIVIAPRTQEELYEDIPSEGDLTEILKARVYRKDGGVAFPLEEQSEGRRPRIRWPELSPGDVVEVAIRTWTARAVGGRADPPYYFLDYAGSTSAHPLSYNEVDVEAPPQTPIYIDVLHAAPGTFQRIEKDEHGRHVTRLIWAKPPSIEEEPLAPALSEIVPLIMGSTFKSWTDFRKWYADAVTGFTEPDDQVKRLAAELTKGKASREQKLKAIFDFVADDIRYVNYQSGEFWLPNRPQQLLARREGDCDDKAILLITLLRAVGIQAQEVMVQTRETGQPSVVRAKNVAVPLFDHGIAFLPGPGGGRYLDATSPQSRLGPLPSMDARAVALRLDTGPAEIVQLPAGSPDDHGSDVTWSMTLKDSGGGDIAGEEHHTGDSAFFLRTGLKEPDARAQYVEDNLLSGWFSTVRVDKDVSFDADLGAGAVRVKYKAHSDSLARREGHDLVVPLSPSWTFTSALAPLVKRTLPVVLPPQLAPNHQIRTLRITAPAGYKWTELAPGGEVNGGEFGRASLEVARDPRNPRVLVVKRKMTLDANTIPVTKYPAWRAFLQRVDALMHRTVRAGGAS
jgi:transglutaminase-like putative cysteine protease